MKRLSVSLALLVALLVASRTSDAQTFVWKPQGSCSVTTGAVVQPSLKTDACTGAGTPTWATGVAASQVNFCAITVTTTAINWLADTSGTAPATGAGPAAQTWQPGNYVLVGNSNVNNFRMIGTTSTAAVSLACGR